MKSVSSKKKPDFINGLYDSGRATMDLGVEAVNNDPVLFREVVELSFSQPYPINMRTARVVQLCCEKNPALILPLLDEVIERMATAKTNGVKRSYLKVINDYTGIKCLNDPGLLLQICFDWLMSPREAIAIRYHCLGILLKISEVIPEIRPELLTVVEFIHEGEPLSPGMLNICNKAIKSLSKK